MDIEKNNSSESKMIFTKMNYLIMLAGIVIIMIGYFLMQSETAQYGKGFIGWTLGPIIVFIGFLVEFVAIFYKPKNQ